LQGFIHWDVELAAGPPQLRDVMTMSLEVKATLHPSRVKVLPLMRKSENQS